MKEQYSSPLMDQISITQMDQFSIDKNKGIKIDRKVLIHEYINNNLYTREDMRKKRLASVQRIA